MVVKVNSADRSSSANGEAQSASTAAAADPLRGVSSADASRVARSKETEVEFSRLKKLVPAISKKQSVSKLDVILEAIRYIDQLQDQLKLVDQLSSEDLVAATRMTSVAAEGKENAVTGATPESMIIKAITEKKRRHKSQ